MVRQQEGELEKLCFEKAFSLAFHIVDFAPHLILSIIVFENWIELKELKGSLCWVWDSEIGRAFNQITPLIIWKRPEGGVLRGRRHQGMTTTALWGGSVPCLEQWARRWAWQTTGGKPTAINYGMWGVGWALIGQSDSLDCAFPSWNGGCRKRSRFIPEDDESHIVYFETEASH